MSLVELIGVWRRERANIDAAISRQKVSGIALQDNLIDALNQAKMHQRLENVSGEWQRRSAVRVRIFSRYLKNL